MYKVKYITANDSGGGSGISIGKILIRTAAVVGAEIILLVLLAIVMTYTDIGQSGFLLFGKIALYIGAFFAGFVNSIGRPKNGWLSGLTAAIVFFLIIAAMGMLMSNSFGASYHLLINALICCVTGCIGGIFGINIGK